MVSKNSEENITMIKISIGTRKKLGQLKYLWNVNSFDNVIQKLFEITTKMQNAGEL
jgi:hypothetical protein